MHIFGLVGVPDCFLLTETFSRVTYLFLDNKWKPKQINRHLVECGAVSYNTRNARNTILNANNTLILCHIEFVFIHVFECTLNNLHVKLGGHRDGNNRIRAILKELIKEVFAF